jgi:hypothetical protein
VYRLVIEAGGYHLDARAAQQVHNGNRFQLLTALR